MALKDTLAVLQAEVTKTADFPSAGFDLLSVSSQALRSRNGLYAEIKYKAATCSGGNANTIQFDIQQSDDNSNWTTCISGAAEKITLSETAKSGVIYLPLVTDKRYTRLLCDVTVGLDNQDPPQPYTATITYQAYLVVGLP